MIKVSVCVVTYNQEQYILEQVTDFEVIVSDNTRNIINDFAQKYSFIKPILRENNIGALSKLIIWMEMIIGW